MPYIFLIKCYVFWEATTTVLECFTNFTGKHLRWSVFSLKMMKFYKDICCAWISRTSAENFYLINWRHKRLKYKKSIAILRQISTMRNDNWFRREIATKLFAKKLYLIFTWTTLLCSLLKINKTFTAISQ